MLHLYYLIAEPFLRLMVNIDEYGTNNAAVRNSVKFLFII
jgi:hypothetical protein